MGDGQLHWCWGRLFSLLFRPLHINLQLPVGPQPLPRVEPGVLLVQYHSGCFVAQVPRYLFVVHLLTIMLSISMLCSFFPF